MDDIHVPESSQAATPTKPSGARPFLWLGLVCACALGLFWAYRALHANEESTDDAQVEADVVQIAARVRGVVAKLAVQTDQRVRAGELLLELDPAELQARLAQAEAELATTVAQANAAEAQEQVTVAGATGGLDSAKARVSTTRVDVRNADAQVAVAEAALSRARADAKKTELDLVRTKTLHAGGSVTSEELDSAQLAYDATHAALAQAEANLALTKQSHLAAESRVAEAQGSLTANAPLDARVAAAHAQTELARARVKAAEAAVTLAQLELSYTKVLAPTDGAVSKISARVGGLLAPGQPVAELVPDASYVVASFKETQTGRMRPGQPATIRLDAHPGVEIHGVVKSLSSGTGSRFSLLPPDNASGNFVKVIQRVPVQIAWQKPAALQVQIGMSAEVTVHVDDGSKHAATTPR